MKDLTLVKMSVADLLKTHVNIQEELRRRDVLRTANNPTGDLAEYLFCEAFNWIQAINSQSGYDAIDNENTRYQIKGRRVHYRNKSRQMSALRNLASRPFDVLAGVLFDDTYKISRAALVPFEIVLEQAAYSKHTNSHIFHLRDSVWEVDGVVDVTKPLHKVLSV